MDAIMLRYIARLGAEVFLFFLFITGFYYLRYTKATKDDVEVMISKEVESQIAIVTTKISCANEKIDTLASDVKTNFRLLNDDIKKLIKRA